MDGGIDKAWVFGILLGQCQLFCKAEADCDSQKFNDSIGFWFRFFFDVGLTFARPCFVRRAVFFPEVGSSA